MADRLRLEQLTRGQAELNLAAIREHAKDLYDAIRDEMIKEIQVDEAHGRTPQLSRGMIDLHARGKLLDFALRSGLRQGEAWHALSAALDARNPGVI